MEGPIALPGRTSPLHLLIRLPFPVFFFWKMSLLCVCHHFPQYDTGLLSSAPERTVLGWCNKVDIFMGDHVKNKLKEDSRLFIEGFFSAVFFFFCLVLSCLVSIYSRSSCTFLKSWMLLEVIPQPPPVSDIFLHESNNVTYRRAIIPNLSKSLKEDRCIMSELLGSHMAQPTCNKH